MEKKKEAYHWGGIQVHLLLLIIIYKEKVLNCRVLDGKIRNIDF
jgi:hypothetical protein